MDVGKLMDRASAAVRKKYGGARSERAARELEPAGLWASTGSAVLDRAIAGKLPGGIPMGPNRGRTVHVYGDPSLGKSLLLDHMMKSVQDLGGVALVCETEGSRDPHFAKAIGLDLERVEIQRPASIEALFDEALAWLASLRGGGFAGPVLVGWDSLEMTEAQRTAREEMGEGKYSQYGAGRPQAIAAGCRKVAHVISREPTTFVIINQVRENPTVMFGNKMVKPGGKAVPFFASVEIYLRKSALGVVIGERKRAVGRWVHFKIEKNKLSPPFAEGDFLIRFDRGINRWSGMLETLTEEGRVALAVGSPEFAFKPTGEVVEMGDFVRWAEANKERL